MKQLKPLPDFDDTGLMAARGRRSALMSARNEAAEALRDACVAVQSADVSEVGIPALAAILAAERLQSIAALWEQLT